MLLLDMRSQLVLTLTRSNICATSELSLVLKTPLLNLLSDIYPDDLSQILLITYCPLQTNPIPQSLSSLELVS